MADRVSGVLALFVAAAVTYSVHPHTFMKNGVPGAALFPFLTAVFIAGCGVTLLLAPGDAQPNWPTGAVRAKLVGSLGALVLYVILVPIIGFAIASAIFLATLIGWWGKYRPWVAALIGGGIAGAMYVVFTLLLEVPLPAAFWS